MRIVDRKTFLSLPADRVFAKYEPHVCGHLSIKGNTMDGCNDFFVTLLDAVSSVDADSSSDTWDTLEKAGIESDTDGESGKEIKTEFSGITRDGLHEDGQLFLVLSADDVKALIDRLTECL